MHWTWIRNRTAKTTVDQRKIRKVMCDVCVIFLLSVARCVTRTFDAHDSLWYSHMEHRNTYEQFFIRKMICRSLRRSIAQRNFTGLCSAVWTSQLIVLFVLGSELCRNCAATASHCLAGRAVRPYAPRHHLGGRIHRSELHSLTMTNKQRQCNNRCYICVIPDSDAVWTWKRHCEGVPYILRIVATMIASII